MADSPRPIKVGSGYIEVVPKVLQKDMAELRKQVTTEMEKIGVQGSKDLSNAVSRGLAGLPKEAAKQAKKAKQAVESEAKDTAETLAKLEKYVTTQFGQEAAKRLKELREFYLKYEGLTEDASETTQRALRETVRQEERAAQDRIAAERTRVRDSARLAEQQRRDAEREQREQTRIARREEQLRVQAAREAQAQILREQRAALVQQVANQREATRQQIASIRQQADAARTSAQSQLSDQQRIITQTRRDLTRLRSDITSASTSTQNFFNRAGTSLRTIGTWFENVGTSITETGNILVTRFLAPLAAAGTALSVIGVKSADTRLLGQLGLTAAGVSAGTANTQMGTIQQYAIDTPFSVDVMHEYQMRLIRSMAGADENWFSTNPNVRTKAADKAAVSTTQLIQSIGDSMARSGNLDPGMFQRAMYAIDMIMDRDRAPTRNITQLVAATGIPAAELANLLGFPDAESMWKKIGTPVAKGGGVGGQEIVDALLENWNGSNGREGSKGYAAATTSATITGRLQQMREQATYNLGSMFTETDDGGRIGYSALGERLMGVKTAQLGPQGQVQGYTYEGGLLQQLQEMGTEYGHLIPKFLNKFFDAIQSFVDMIDSVATYLKEHPAIMELVSSVANFLIEWGPLILIVGLLAKTFGKIVGIAGKLLSPLAALVRTGVVARDSVQNTRSQRQAGRTARQAALDSGASGREARRAGQAAYRQQRTDNRDGDDRSNLRRALGIGSVDQSQARAIRELEARLRDAQDRAGELRDEMRGINQTQTRDIRNALDALAQTLAGNSSNSVQGAANRAQNAVNNVATQGVTSLNNADLNQLLQEISQVEERVRKTAAEISNAHTELNQLNGAKLNQATAELTALRNAAEETGKQITSDNTRIGNLNNKDVKGVTGSVKDLTTEAKRAADQIGDGAMSSSTSGRTANLNKRRLTDVIAEFRKLTNEADDAFKKIGQGTGAGSLAGRVGLLNGRSLKKLTDAVRALAKELGKARDEGEGLDRSLDSIGKKSPGGGSGSGSKKKKNARGGVATHADVALYGGVMPGYAPWVDSIPAILSPGEAVLRPEVTRALGEDRINAWNALAMQGQISRFATGGIAGRLEGIQNLIDLQNVAPIGSAMARTLRLDSSSDSLGGSTQQGILGTGDKSAGFGGSVASGKFQGLYDWMTDGLWDQMRDLPTGVGQLIGVIAGAMAPIQGEYFWNDVWKGQGNIVSRGKAYMGDIFSTKTLGKLWDNATGGIWDSLTAIWDTGKAIVTDPFGAVQDAVQQVWDIAAGSYNNFIGMIDTVRDIKDSPMAYAGRVFTEFMSTAQESMPNTKGLFDFSEGSKIGGKAPDVTGGMNISAPSGSGVQRWAPTALQAMGMLGIPPSYLDLVLHRIQVESGGNPNIVNKWDSNWAAGHPSVGLMQVIGPTYKAYDGPFSGTGPFLYGTSVNPLANIYAGLNYARSRYGSKWVSALSGTRGYATGTMSASPGFALVGERGPELVNFQGGERVYPADETAGLLSGNKYEIHIHEAKNEPTPQAVLRALQTAEALYTRM
ncbi:transglycosylase SLT domain-containing protein [Streptomyces sp. NPDC055036]